MCFPATLSLPQGDSAPAAGVAADTRAKSSSSKPFSALDGLWQMLQQAPDLLQAQPKLLAAGMRLLSTLWECQGSAHGAVELLRLQPSFWNFLKVCRLAAKTLSVANMRLPKYTLGVPGVQLTKGHPEVAALLVGVQVSITAGGDEPSHTLGCSCVLIHVYDPGCSPVVGTYHQAVLQASRVVACLLSSNSLLRYWIH